MRYMRNVSALSAALLIALGAHGFALAAPASGWAPASASQAKRMAEETGFATKTGTPKRCWRAELVASDPRFGVVYKTEWGKAHSYDAGQTCGPVESYLAPIAVYSGGRWVKVADIYFPDCRKLKSALRSYGASAAVIRTLVTALPPGSCG